MEHSNCPIISHMLQLQGYKPQQCAFRDCWGYGFGHRGSCVAQYIYKYQQALNAHSTVASCHWEFNHSSSSSSPFQNICLFFCNLDTSLTERSGLGILTGIVTMSVQGVEDFSAIIPITEFSFLPTFSILV